MATPYTYPDTNQFDLVTLGLEIHAALPAVIIVGIAIDTDLVIKTQSPLSAGDETILDGVVAAHGGVTDPRDFVLTRIQSAQGNVIDEQSGGLKVFQVNPGGGGGDGNCSTSTKFRLDHSFTKVDLNRSTESFDEIYNYAGSGRLKGFKVKFNSDRVRVKLTVDGEEIFDIDMQDWEDFFGYELPEGDD